MDGFGTAERIDILRLTDKANEISEGAPQMRNRLNFASVFGILIENKKKQYPQHQMIRDLFSLSLDDTMNHAELTEADKITFSRWINNERPITAEIVREYENDEWDAMEYDFRKKIIPNLLNEDQARTQI